MNQPYLQYVFVNLKLSSEMPKWKHVLFTFVLLKWSCSLMVLHWHRCWKIYICYKWTKKNQWFYFYSIDSECILRIWFNELQQQTLWKVYVGFFYTWKTKRKKLHWIEPVKELPTIASMNLDANESVLNSHICFNALATLQNIKNVENC